MLRHFAGCLFVVALLCPAECWGQGSAVDYERAEKLAERFSGKVLNERIDPRFSDDRKWLFYRRELPNGQREHLLVDTVTGKKSPMFDAVKLAAALSKELSRKVEPMQLPIGNTVLMNRGKYASFQMDDRRLLWDRQSHQLLPIETLPKPPRAKEDRSPDRPRPPKRKYVAFFRDHNVHVRDVATGVVFPLSTDGTEAAPYTGGLIYSDDSTRLLVMQVQRGLNRKIPLVESSPKDSIHSRLVMHPYVKPGDPIDQPTPHLFDLTSRKQIPITPMKLFENPWSIDELEWDQANRRYTCLYNQRGHQVMRWIGIDADTGTATAIIEERSPTFIDWTAKVHLSKIAGTDDVIWMSERSGWNHLYRINGRTGVVRNAITSGDWLVHRVEKVIVHNGKPALILSVRGINPSEDPYHLHFIRIHVDGTGLTRLTHGDGTHQVNIDPDQPTYIDRFSRVDLAPVTELRRTGDGELICQLERGDIRALKAVGWQQPERFTAMGRDDKTPIYGVIFRPTNFDPKRHYPVIEDIYAGPHAAHTPKSFRSHFGHQTLAELGFIVVQMDGMGTSQRSKAFHDVCWKNLGDSGFPDRIRWMQAAAAKYPYLDLSRVGIFGTSAGGQSALRGMLAHPDFYKVAVADCGCHDNRVDKIWWNEQWMGYPIGPHYAEQSNVTQAHRLTGKLMLMVGEMDRNVDPASTYQVVNALIKADKDFDLIVFPGAGHGSGTPYAQRRRRDFLVRHLLGVEPRWVNRPTTP